MVEDRNRRPPRLVHLWWLQRLSRCALRNDRQRAGKSAKSGRPECQSLRRRRHAIRHLRGQSQWAADDRRGHRRLPLRNPAAAPPRSLHPNPRSPARNRSLNAGARRVPHVRTSVRGTKTMGEALRSLSFIGQKNPCGIGGGIYGTPVWSRPPPPVSLLGPRNLPTHCPPPRISSCV